MKLGKEDLQRKNISVWLALVPIAVLVAMLALVIKEYIKKRRQDKEDAEMFV